MSTHPDPFKIRAIFDTMKQMVAADDDDSDDENDACRPELVVCVFASELFPSNILCCGVAIISYEKGSLVVFLRRCISRKCLISSSVKGLNFSAFWGGHHCSIVFMLLAFCIYGSPMRPDWAILSLLQTFLFIDALSQSLR